MQPDTHERQVPGSRLPTDARAGGETWPTSCGNAPRAARRAKAPALAAEGQQLVVPAISAAQAQEPVGQDAALQEAVELVLDEAGQFTAGAVLSVRDEAGRMLLHQPAGGPADQPGNSERLSPARTRSRARDAQGADQLSGGDVHDLIPIPNPPCLGCLALSCYSTDVGSTPSHN